jgi:hypothetical protein
MARPKREHKKATVVKRSSPSTAPSARPKKDGVFSRFAVSAGTQAGKATVGFLLANPFVALVAIIIGIIVTFILASYAAVTVTNLLYSPIWWALAILFSVILRPTRSTSILLAAVLVSGIFFIIENYQAYQELQDICSIPIMGFLVCGTTYTVWLFNFLLYTAATFVVVLVLSYVRNALINA